MNCRWETERDGRNFVIRWGHRPINPPESLTFVLRYRVRGAIEIDQAGDLDSITWEALFGNRKRGATIERAVVTLRLPGGLPPQLRRQESFGVDADSRWLDARTVEFIPRESLPGSGRLAVQVSFPHGLVDGPAPTWRQGFGIFEKTPLTNWFPNVSLSEPTDLIHWGLRFSGIGLILLLFAASRIRKSRWPKGDYPPQPEGLTELPTNLPAPVVSALETREVGPQTYLSILVDLLQKGNLTITGRSSNEGTTQSIVNLSHQSEPDLPWEKVVYDQVSPQGTKSNDLKRTLDREKAALRDHLDEYLLSRGMFDQPPLRVMAEQRLGWMGLSVWWLAAIIVGLGLGLWVNLFFSPWWAGTAAGALAALVFGKFAIDSPAGRIAPTELGALEISRWRGFDKSINDGLVNPDPDQNDSLLPYAVALNLAGRWINDINAIPPWFRLPSFQAQIPQNRQRAYLGFIGADSWALDGGPKIEANLPSSGGRGGGGRRGGGDGGDGGDGGGGDGGG